MAQPSNKRKRATEDIGRVEEAKPGPSQDDDYTSILQLDADNQRTAQAALAEHIYPDPAFEPGALPEFGETSPPQSLNAANNQSLYPASTPQAETPGPDKGKPTLGTPAWHEARKASHKEGM